MRLFAFGLGYTARAFIARTRDLFTDVAGTARTTETAARMKASGIRVHALDVAAESAVFDDIGRADALLVSAAPVGEGDPFLARFGPALDGAGIGWIGYLSTIGVYGDRGGAWVDEAEPPSPVSRRARERIAAEAAWFSERRTDAAVHVFRLAGIYGPGRNALVKLARGEARRVVKPGQVFNRIHVDDIAAVLAASIRRPRGGAIYNVSDDEPGPPQDVIAYAAELAGIPPPPEVAFADADLGPMARAFYADNKRIANRRIKDELGVRLTYPSYREGLKALLDAGEFTQGGG